jgi:transposase
MKQKFQTYCKIQKLSPHCTSIVYSGREYCLLSYFYNICSCKLKIQQRLSYLYEVEVEVGKALLITLENFP